MICSTCSAVAPIGVRTGQRALGRVVSWYQCFGCFNAEQAQQAREREDDAKRAPVKRGRR